MVDFHRVLMKQFYNFYKNILFHVLQVVEIILHLQAKEKEFYMYEHIILTIPHNYRVTRAIFIFILILSVYVLKHVSGYPI